MMNLEKEIREQPAVLAGILSANRKTLDDLILRLRKENPASAFFASRGTSDHAAIYAQYLFGLVLGLPCGLTTPSLISKYNANLTFRNTVVFGISQSGAAEDVIRVIRKARQDGSVTVAVTNNPDSALAKEAEYSLCCQAGPETSIAATKTFTAQMYLLSLVCGLWANDAKLLSALDRLPAFVAEVLDTMPAALDALTPRYRYLTDGFVLGRGFGYPIALEGALKILETNRIHMKGYAISDFQHGPMAQIQPGTFVILVAPKGEVSDDADSILARLMALGAEVVVLTDDPELAAKGSIPLLLPNTGCEAMTAYLAAVTLQLFAMKLTIVKGIDPDSSNVLKKITVTI